MMNESQEKTIIDFLLYKKLPLDIASEVFDHMVLQIGDLMDTRQLSFDEAWLETKKSWNAELKTIYNPLYSLDDITILVKDLQRKQWIQTVKRIWPFAVGAALMILLLFWILPRPWDGAFLLLFMAVYLVMGIFGLRQSLKIKKLQNRFVNNKLSMIPNQGASVAASTGGLVGALGLIIQYMQDGNESIFYEFSPVGQIFFFLLFWFGFSGLCGQLLLYFSSKDKLQQKIKEIEPFLQKVLKIK